MSSHDPPDGDILSDQMFLLARSINDWSSSLGGEHYTMALVEELLEKTAEYQSWLHAEIKRRGLES
jgi:hypothetical protein